MPRTVTISIPSDRTDALVGDLRAIPGILTLHRQRGASLQPRGDVVTVQVADRSTSSLVKLLTAYGAGTDDAVSVTTSEPDGVVSSASAEVLSRDVATSSFEAIEFTLDREATFGANELVVMAVAGVVATAGIVTNALHLVMGAMLVAPGFEPLLKISLALAVGGGAGKRGLIQIAKGYGVLVAGSAMAGLLLRATGVVLPAEAGSYLGEGALVSYWRSVTTTATVVAVVSAVAGALLVAANRAVLTAGVMVALALVPGAALMGLGMAAGRPGLILDGAVRWGHDAVVVVAVGAATFGAMRLRRRRRLHT